MSDIMLFGVLRMPYEMAMDSELSRIQFYGRAQEAADRLEALLAQLEAAPVPAAPEDGGLGAALDEAVAEDAAQAKSTALQALVDQAQELNMGYGAPVDERAAFVQFVNLHGISGKDFDLAAKAFEAGRAALQQPGQAVPDGWKLVPNDQNMTDDQAEAIAKMANCCGGMAYDIYRVALAAAPVSGAVPGEPG